MNEFARWCPEIRAVRFHGPKPDRAAFVRDVLKPGASRRDYDVVVTTYEVANAEQKSLEKVSWRFVVIDEAHRIKNEASLFARTARSLASGTAPARDGHAPPEQPPRALGLVEFSITGRLRVVGPVRRVVRARVVARAGRITRPRPTHRHRPRRRPSRRPVNPRPRRFDLDVDDDDAKKTMISQLHKLLRPFVLKKAQGRRREEHAAQNGDDSVCVADEVPARRTSRC